MPGGGTLNAPAEAEPDPGTAGLGPANGDGCSNLVGAVAPAAGASAGFGAPNGVCGAVGGIAVGCEDIGGLGLDAPNGVCGAVGGITVGCEAGGGFDGGAGRGANCTGGGSGGCWCEGGGADGAGIVAGDDGAPERCCAAACARS